MKKRNCPCCSEEISIIYFIKHMFAGKKGFSFVKNEKGFVCKKCNNSIFSAEKKDGSVNLLFFFSFAPFPLFAFYDASFIFIMSVAFSIFTIGVWITYYNITFICNDENSDMYNDSSIHS